MNRVDLTLVPIEELIGEIKNRTTNFVIGYTRQIDQEAPALYIDSAGESFLAALGLAEEIKQLIFYKTRCCDE